MTKTINAFGISLLAALLTMHASADLVDTDGNAVTNGTALGDIDMAVSTYGDLKDGIAPNFNNVSNAAMSAAAGLSGKQDKLPYETNAIPQSAITGLSTSLDDKRDMTNLTYECISEQWDFSLWQAIVPGEYMIGDGQPGTIPFYYRANGTGNWSEAGYGFLSESGTEYTPSTTAEDFRQIEGVTITRAVRDTLALVSNIPTNVSAFNNDAGYVTTSIAAETYQPKGDYALASALAAAAAAATNHTDTAVAASATASTNYTDAAVLSAATAATNYTDSAAVAAVSTAVSTSKAYTDTSTNAVIQHVDAMDTSYYRFETITNVNQSVQYVATDANTTELRILMPATGMTKDWLVYIYPAADLNIVLPGPADYWCASYDVTNSIPAGVPTALYFSQITEGVFSLGRKKLDCPITISSPLTAKLRAAQAASRRTALSARRPTLTATALKTAAKPAATAAKPTAAAVKAATTNTTATAAAPAKK